MPTTSAHPFMPRRAVTLVAACASATILAGAHADPHWFASEVVQYLPAPGQFVNDPDFNNPARALGAPVGGGTNNADLSKLVTLGGFGGSITLRFASTVWNDPCNPMGLDAIVFGNAVYVSGDPRRRFAEAAHIEISLDANGNGIADDQWYIIRGSSLPSIPATALRTQQWDDDESTPAPPMDIFWYPFSLGFVGPYTTVAYELPSSFAQQIISLPAGATAEAIYGYADFTPVMALPGGVDPIDFYTIPDDPFNIGITPGSGGGDAFDIAWAVHPITGEPANLPGFDFIRITTGVDAISGFFGEISAEIGGVARVRSRVLLAGDANGDGVVNFADLNAVLTNFGAGGANLEGDVNCDGVVNFADLNAVLTNFGASLGESR
ncbi:MAG: hypothetical protein KF684_00340 [Phycisphaeraceae bacterium]|nr:hypothetical protein [Phycisphaeraceae bacterium]